MSGRRKRLSADLPQNWLHDPAYWALSDRAWRLHTHGLMWAIGRTDGYIPQDMLSMLLPGGDADRELAVKELAAAGTWKRVTGGWLIIGWDESQSTVAEIERNREADRKRQARHRAGSGESHAVTDAVTNGMSTARHGTSRDGTDGNGISRPQPSTNAEASGSGCAAPGCPKPARSGCRTCWQHAQLELSS